MAERVTYHIMPGANGGWDVVQEHTGNVFGNHRSRTDAILQGRDLAQTHEYSLLVVHDRAGQVEKQYNYGRLPPRTPQAKSESPSNTRL
ncbi:MAG: DUF2188 domain-containing protein [Planctomycetes bacterium]|jgi:hypothetical protein|nr:DUF2188 domain-containing protein [Planctomycetota bacterium]